MKKRILGISIDDLSMKEMGKKISGYLTDGAQHTIILPYSLFFVESAVNPNLKSIFNNADMSLIDGKGVALAYKLLYNEPVFGIRGIDLIYYLCNLLNDGSGSMFFFGAKSAILKNSVKKIKSKFENLNIAGFSDGYAGRKNVIDEINKVKPDVLLVALGMPLQEFWMNEYLKLMPSIKIAVGIGGALEIISDNKKRIPKFIQDADMEWMWRIFIQPARTPKVIRSVFGFGRLVVKHRLGNEFAKEKDFNKYHENN